MYLGQKSIDLLSAFIEGYQYAIDSYQIIDEMETRFQKFRVWVINFYHAEEYTGGWKQVILDNCDDDSEKAVDVFFDLYDQFKTADKAQ